MLRMAVVTALAGCTGYQPGSFSQGVISAGGPVFEGQRATVGCLDVAVARRVDYDASAVLQYQFGNRCGREVEVDLQRVAVVGRFADGQEVALAPYDPSLELRPMRLGGRLVGREAIAYPTPRPAVQVCVDAASIVHAQPAHWLCFGSPLQGDTEGEGATAEASAGDSGAGRDDGPFSDAPGRAGQPAVPPEATP